MGTAQPLPVDRGSGRFDSEQALRPTREELDAMSLPPCIADERIEQPFDVEGPDRAKMEAACGLRPYAITVVGDRELVDAFAGARGDAIASVVFDPPTD